MSPIAMLRCDCAATFQIVLRASRSSLNTTVVPNSIVARPMTVAAMPDRSLEVFSMVA